jgi:16S rRNA (uracil1498-N3)-methyltransferase
MPRPPRFFITPEHVSGQRVIISGEDVHHIAAVLRMKPGEMLLLCDGQGAEYTVKIARVGRSEIATEIVSQSRRVVHAPQVTLGQGLPKSDKMDFIVQKATELGVSEIIPLRTERTIVKVKDEEKRVMRWQKIAREASMQSSRVDIPVIGQIVSFKDFLRTQNPELRTLLLLPWEEGTQPIKEVLRTHTDVKKIILLIGPEGGFSTTEAEAAKESGFHLVSLGQNILRTETAAIAALSMVLYETMSNA